MKQAVNKAVTPLASLVVALCWMAMTVPAAMAQNQEERRLSVEFIVFEHSGSGHEEERWARQSQLPAIADAVEIDDRKAQELGLRRAQAERRLSGAAERLSNSRGYRVLRHERWILPERDRDNSPLIRVHLDQIETADRQAPPSERQRYFGDDHLVDHTEAASDEPSFTPARPLDGTLRVFRSRYFHISADLLFDPERDEESVDPEQQSDERAHRLEALMAGQISFDDFQAESDPEPFPGYRLSESRRLRLGELHYLDHPRFGVLVRLDRVDD